MIKFDIVFLGTDIRSNREDFVLTPFLFLVKFNGISLKVLGIGICWFYWSASINFKIEK